MIAEGTCLFICNGRVKMLWVRFTPAAIMARTASVTVLRRRVVHAT